jgi:NarL family two-component system response regulator LiaR
LHWHLYNLFDMTEKIEVLVVDDHAIVREGLRAIIDSKADMEVVGEAVDGVEAVLLAKNLQPDVILMDIIMPHKDGIEAINEIMQENPQTKILVLTSYTEDEKVFAAIKAGAIGYVLKETTPSDLLQAIRGIHRGDSILHPSIARKLIRELQPAEVSLSTSGKTLTERELEILKLVAHGLNNEDIGEYLRISERTVGSHISKMLDKLHLSNRTQAALYALRKGLTTLSSQGD